MVIAQSHEIVSPRDAASGLPTGKRQHKPMVITKEVDKSSPLLYNALVNNENLSSFELKFMTPDSAAAAEKNHYTVKLTNANIASISMRMHNNKVPDLMKLNAHRAKDHEQHLAGAFEPVSEEARKALDSRDKEVS